MESIKEYLKRGPAKSKEIQAYTGLSQGSISTKLKAMGDKIVRIQDGRAPRYAMSREAFGGGNRIPISTVDLSGNSSIIAYLRPLLHGGFFVESVKDTPSVLLGDSLNGLYDDLPYFLYDLRPQGFLGKKIAETMASLSDGFPKNPERWNSEHIGKFLMINGDDMHGNIRLGESLLLRIPQKTTQYSRDEYQQLAQNAIAGEVPGSSAGGEQPKFAVYCKECLSHVIVKFSPTEKNEIAERWRDILISEYHATKTLQSYGFSTSDVELSEIDNQLFLESNRFDRHGAIGRSSMISLRSIDSEFVGLGENWPAVLKALAERELVKWDHVYEAEVLWHFGHYINNSDMHLGNISLAIDGDGFRLLPVYDMCSMGFAPTPGGHLRPYAFKEYDPEPLIINREVLMETKEMAYEFWENLKQDLLISEKLKKFLKLNPMG
ncbi:HipA domain protein [Desulfamplus magnetovallimortis]|uniref:HipA domain protein n=1 Tax=Desulfamplus magnetovallimortis TaxID=1246637 RepID=A0A1W1HI99_9BACT|nr:type II toxin-antitoxin system HipA family toxin YjjJ [Desulfamplus magnetovallimortis]SLM32153.1 HipA domain protein [Desulfamplus magnetovallimortis]